MSSLSRLLTFIRTDVLWLLSGQLIALVVGLISLKVFTNLLEPEQYAYIALLMAMSAWIWTGLYQPLNQTIFRLYSSAKEEGWEKSFFSYVFQYEKRLTQIVMVFLVAAIAYGVVAPPYDGFHLIVVLSAVMGVSYGCVHGFVSFYSAQRKRQAVALIQSFDGMLRLLGGLSAFYWFYQTQYAIAAGMVVGGALFFIVVMGFAKPWQNTQEDKLSQLKKHDNKSVFSRYYKSMFIVMFLSATVVHLDKWLLFSLLRAETLGAYAVIYTLAMTITTVLFVFFEILLFPLIFNESSPELQKKLIVSVLWFYAICLSFLLIVVSSFGDMILTVLTTNVVAQESSLFFWLIVACGVINLGRILMVRGQIEKVAHKYWPAYVALMVFFVGWCIACVNDGDGMLAAQGYMMGAMIYLVVIVILNLRMRKIKNAH